MSDPSSPDSGAKKPLDLKSRLGLKTSAAIPTASAPVSSSSALPPPPSRAVLPPPPAPKPEGPTAESIDEARARAEALAASAGPAFEEFSIGGGPEQTPVPVEVAGGVRVEYVDVGATELSPEVKKRNRMVLIGAVLATALVAFFLGRAMSSSSALNELKDNMVFEAEEKLAFLNSNKPTFVKIDALVADLKVFNDRAAAVGTDGKGLVELEEPLGKLLLQVAAFVEAKAFIDPGAVIGKSVYNGELMASVLGFASRTQQAYLQASALLEEAQTLVSMWRQVPPELQKHLVFSDTEEREHPELGKIQMGVGRLIANTGAPKAVELQDSSGKAVGTEYQMMVMLRGEKDPIQVKTTQVTLTDLGLFFEDNLNQIKGVSLARLSELTQRLHKALSGCKPGPVEAQLKEFLVKAGATVSGEGASEAKADDAPAKPEAPAAEVPATPEAAE